LRGTGNAESDPVVADWSQYPYMVRNFLFKMLHKKNYNWSACSKENNFGFSFWHAAGLRGK